MAIEGERREDMGIVGRDQNIQRESAMLNVK